MIIRRPSSLRYSDVTPKEVYLNRRRFLGVGTAAVAALAGPFSAQATVKLNVAKSTNNAVGEKVTSKDLAGGFNNFYEFGTGKEEPAQNAPKWKVPSPWMVKIDGEVGKAQTMDLDAIMKLAPLEER